MNVRIRRWAQMERWDWVQRADLSSCITRHRLESIGSFLRRRREPVNRTAVSFSDLVPISIHFDGSISRRQIKHGKEYSLAMQWAHPGDVVLSKIDLKNAAVGLLPEDWRDVAVTSHFAVYEPIHEKVSGMFFRLLIQSPPFKEWLASNKSGADGRKEVKLEDFEALEIPLPEPDAQRALVEAYETGLCEAAAAEKEAAEIERRGLQEFEAALGLTPPPDLPRRPVQIARFRDIDRWSHEGILYRGVVAARGASTERFALVALGDVVADLENGWSPQCLSTPARPDQWGVLKLGAVSFGEYDESENKALPPHLDPLPALEIQRGDVLISRANIPRLIGACAHVRATRSHLMLCDKIFRVVFLKSSGVLPEFLAEVLKAPSVRQQIESSATGTSPTMRNISKPALLELTFPLPQGADGLVVQKRLIDNLARSRTAASRRRHEAKGHRAAAWEAFLAAVFS